MMLRSVVKRQAATAASASVRRTAVLRSANGQANGLRDFHSSPISEALSKFAMPAMSPTMTEGGIATWKKKEGESYAQGDVLLEVETDKATMDVEAQDDGIVAKIIIGDGSKSVPVGKPIAIMAEEGDEIDGGEVDKLASEAGKEEPPKQDEGKKEEKKEEAEAPKKEEKDDKPKKDEKPKKDDKPQKKPEESKPRDAIFATPAAKRIALERGVPLGQIKGSGPNGRILEKDVDNFKSSSPSPGSPAPPSGGAAGLPMFTDNPVSGMRRTIATRLTESKRDIPGYYLTAEINMDKVNQLRSLFNAAAAAGGKGGKEGVKEGTKLSVNDFVLKGAALALADVPEVNAGWHGDFVRQYHKADISVAVATPTGLITPIVTDVGARGLASISAASKALAAKARDGKLQQSEYQGGSFTVSNLGMFGIHSFTAIINPPQSCILAVGGGEKKVVVDPLEEKGWRETEVMKVTLTCDHRVVDGAIGARWMSAFKNYMENPLSFML